MRSVSEQVAVTDFVRGEYDRIVFQQPNSYVSKNAQSDPVKWQEGLCELIATDPKRAQAICEGAEQKFKVQADGFDSPAKGFTLIELSILLVIIGLIVGGVLAGQDLIRAAELRATISQIEKYNTAANTFRGKFDYLPGDIKDPDASSFGLAARGTLQGEGDGNGVIEGIVTYASPYPIGLVPDGEPMMFWANLSKSGFIDGAFNRATATTTVQVFPTTNPSFSAYIPAAKLGSYSYFNVYSSNGVNYFGLSGVGSFGWYTTYSSPLLTVAQAAGIDSKIDDGLPLSGNVTTVRVNGFLCWPNTSCNSNVGIAQPPSNMSCYDNGGNASGLMQYSMSQSNGSNVNCALSFRFQ